MLRVILLLLAAFPCVALADTYLCVPEAGALVADGPKGISASLADVATHKFVMTNERGAWVVKELGKDFAIFDHCESVYFCENSKGFAGAFWRQDDGIFGVVWTLKDGNVNNLVSAKGKCSKL